MWEIDHQSENELVTVAQLDEEAGRRLAGILRGHAGPTPEDPHLIQTQLLAIPNPHLPNLELTHNAGETAAVLRRCVAAYGPVLYLSHSLLQLELVVRPVFFIEVIVNLLRHPLHLIRPSCQN